VIGATFGNAITGERTLTQYGYGINWPGTIWEIFFMSIFIGRAIVGNIFHRRGSPTIQLGKSGGGKVKIPIRYVELFI